MLTFDSDIQSISFGQEGTDLANLLFVSHDDAPNTPGGMVAPTPTDLTMVDLTTLQQVAVAQGGTRGFDVLATSDGRLLISQSHEVDVLEPVVPPVVVATNPPSGSIAALPLAFIGVTFDQEMFTGSSTNSASVTDPADYSLVGQTSGPAIIDAVQYNPNSKTALLVVSGLTADTYTLTVGRVDPEHERTDTAYALCDSLLDRQQPLPLCLAHVHEHAVRSEYGHGVVRRDDHEHQPVQFAGALAADPHSGGELHRHSTECVAELEWELAHQSRIARCPAACSLRRGRAQPVKR